MVAPVARLLPWRSSLSGARGYLNICARAAADPRALEVFKRDPVYTAILEHVTCEQGARYLELALESVPELERRLDDFRRNDEIGSPRVCEYGVHGTFSPTTLRYVKVLADLLRLFGPLDGMRVIEIGAGYGGQRFVVSRVADVASYALVDLGPCLSSSAPTFGSSASTRPTSPRTTSRPTATTTWS